MGGCKELILNGTYNTAPPPGPPQATAPPPGLQLLIPQLVNQPGELQPAHPKDLNLLPNPQVLLFNPQDLNLLFNPQDLNLFDATCNPTSGCSASNPNPRTSA